MSKVPVFILVYITLTLFSDAFLGAHVEIDHPFAEIVSFWSSPYNACVFHGGCDLPSKVSHVLSGIKDSHISS